MFYLISEDGLSEFESFEEPNLSFSPDPDTKKIFLIKEEEELLKLSKLLELDSTIFADAQETDSMIFEGHSNFDFLSLNIPTKKTAHYGGHKVMLLYNRDYILFYIKDDQTYHQVALEIEKLKSKYLTQNPSLKGMDFLNRTLYVFFEKISIFKIDFLDEFELKIYELESNLIESISIDYVQDIVMLRKDLFNLKRHYEQVLDLLDDIQENENLFLNEEGLRLFKIFNGKVERHFSQILSLRDYVTQVREAYQAQIDIEQNEIMKFFTVITTIFLPLSLIVGWYGMNLKMPEYHASYMYPLIILFSLLIIIINVAYFKRKKWF